MKISSYAALWQSPSTRLGWWAATLLALFVLMFIINAAAFVPLYQEIPNTWWRQALLPLYGILMLLCGLIAGVIGVISIARKHERSWLVWLSILPGAFVIFFVLGEFLVPH